MSVKDEYQAVGKRSPIADAALKVTGRKQYVGDMRIPGMLEAKVLLSPVAHARIKKIDVSKAAALPGVRAVATYENSPEIKFNSALRFFEHQIPFTEKIFDHTVRFVGDKVAAVAADTLEIAKAAVKLIEVEYEPLPVLVDVEEAYQENAYPIHEGGNRLGKVQVNAGDVDSEMDKADHIFEDRYTVPPVNHTAMEPHVAIADYDRAGKLTVYAPCQNIFGYRIILSQIFGLTMNNIRMISPAIGGGFGGKLEMTVEPVAALLSKLSGRPVKLEYNRKESLIATRVRHGAVVYIKTGFMKDGAIHAQDIKVLTNTGAYASSAFNVVGAMSHKVFKAYKIAHMRYTGIPVYTNTPVAGAMRGYGSPQVFFGQQRQLNKIAKFLSMDLVDLQRKNLVEPDSLDPCFHKPHGNPRPLDCLNKGMELIRYHEAVAEQKSSSGRWRIGVGLAIGVHGNGCFGAHRDATTLMIKMNEDGSCILYTGSHDMGNNTIGVQVQILSEILGISRDCIGVVAADTDATPWHLGDYASRGVYVVGGAAIAVADLVKKELLKEASEVLDEEPEFIELRDNQAFSTRNAAKRATLCEVMVHCQRDSGREIICSSTYASPRGASSYGAHFAKVKVDTQTGEVRVLDFAAVHDVGRAMNPLAIEGQLEGAVQMGLGYALSEGLDFDEAGTPRNTSFKTYHIFSATEMPRIYCGFIEKEEPGGPFGGKSIGECSVVPVAPAVVNAVANALGLEDFHSLPLRPETVLKAIEKGR